jgi:hypothetical protein
MCSVYSDGDEYVGILGNFFLLKHPSKSKVYPEQNSSDNSCLDCIDLFGKRRASAKRNNLQDTDINKALNDYIKGKKSDTTNHRKSHM